MAAGECDKIQPIVRWYLSSYAHRLSFLLCITVRICAVPKTVTLRRIKVVWQHLSQEGDTIQDSRLKNQDLRFKNQDSKFEIDLS